MNIEGFLADVAITWDGDPHGAQAPLDRRHLPLLQATGGMDSENKLALLNLAARHLGTDELYLEIGAYRGTSICGAALGNDDKTFITVDDFSQFGGPEDDCRRNLARWTNGNVQLINADAWKTLGDPPFRAPVGVYFYDGGHRFRDQWWALEKVEPLLASEALVIVDDTRHPPTHAANDVYTRGRREWSLLLEFTTSQNEDPQWWNGVEVYGYRRARRVRRRPRFPGYYLGLRRWRSYD